eukprot:TRINITY_DN1789_c0_g1_i4.p1 TRINITY_DN1789_c0_g1~~TRINITY_DN1789_c0_g1_i4.p1  ORF type:complete len:263 (-),score=16.88 TRINITY_DN1789_c0_g1_i4:233-1021(-)
MSNKGETIIIKVFFILGLILFLPIFIIGLVFLVQGLSRNTTPAFQVMLCPSSNGMFVSVPGFNNTLACPTPSNLTNPQNVSYPLRSKYFRSDTTYGVHIIRPILYNTANVTIYFDNGVNKRTQFFPQYYNTSASHQTYPNADYTPNTNFSMVSQYTSNCASPCPFLVSNLYLNRNFQNSDIKKFPLQDNKQDVVGNLFVYADVNIAIPKNSTQYPSRFFIWITLQRSKPGPLAIAGAVMLPSALILSFLVIPILNIQAYQKY